MSRPRNSSLLSAVVAATAVLGLLALVGGSAVAAPPTTTPSAPPTTASGTVDANGVPTDANGNPIIQSWSFAPTGKRTSYSYATATKGVVHDSVVLANYGNVPLQVQVYATDAFNNKQGDFDALPGAQKPVDVGTWVKVAQKNFTVMPLKQLVIPFTMKVPAAATFGDHTGALIASIKSSTPGSNGAVIQLDRRLGIPIYARIKGKLTPHLEISGLATDYTQHANSFNGEATVTYRVNNTGNVRLSGAQEVTVSGPFGVSEHKVHLKDLPELLPGQHLDVTTTVKGLPALFLVSTDVKVTPKGAADAGAVPVASSSDSSFTPPITVLLFVLVGVIVLLVLRARRRRHAPSAAAPAAAVSEREPQPA